MSVVTRIDNPSLDDHNEFIWRTARSDDEQFVVLQQRGWYLGSLGEDGTYWLFMSRDEKYSPCCPEEDRHWEYQWVAATGRYGLDARKLQEEGWQLANKFDETLNTYWYRKAADTSSQYSFK